jgi:hypothetical protein
MTHAQECVAALIAVTAVSRSDVGRHRPLHMSAYYLMSHALGDARMRFFDIAKEHSTIHIESSRQEPTTTTDDKTE